VTLSDSTIGLAPRAGELGRYRLIAELARGGMGIVYLGLVSGPAGFNKLFVVKELKPHLAEDPSLVRMFVDEARLAAKLSHPNVVQTIEVGCDGARPFIAMEYLQGQSLHRILQRGRASGGLPLALHVSAIIGALDGLQHAHALCDFDGTPLCIVHRDMSPQNVLVTYDGTIKVLDFGIAKALDSRDETRTGVLKGKIAYMAPEQAQGVPLDCRADIFAVGVMLWEAAAGRRMWSEATNELQILRALSNGQVPRVRDFAPEVPDTLARIIEKATACAVGDRYPTAARLQEDLAAFLVETREQPTARDLGRYVSRTFADERARMNAIVDGQVKRIRSEPQAATEVPRLDAGSVVPGTPSDFSGQRIVVPQALSTGPLPVAISQEAPAVARRRGGAITVAASGAAAALCTALVAVFFVGRGAAPTAAVSLALPRTVIAPIAAPAAVLDRVPVTVRAEPAGARILVDGAPVGQSPYTGSFAKDGIGHTVRVEAPGYRTQEQSFAAETASVLDFSLEPTASSEGGGSGRGGGHAPARSGGGRGSGKARSVVRDATPAAAAAATAVTAVPSATHTGHGPRTIDRSNPYGH
jgi:serine/threonine-protein kinase